MIANKRGHWKLKSNQRKLFDEVAEVLHIQRYEQWGCVSKRQLIETCSLATSVLRYYKNSLKYALESIYPEITWRSTWFKNLKEKPRGYWEKKETQRKYLETIAQELGIKTPSDWGKVTTRTLIRHKARPILDKYSNSVYEMLVSIFTNITWKREWFVNIHGVPSGFWKDKENQRKYFKEIARIYEIKEPSDWGKLTNGIISTHKSSFNLFYENVPNDDSTPKYAFGASILNHYNKSLYTALKTLFTDISWKKEWFEWKQKKGYWEQLDNQKLFIDHLSKEYSVLSPLDWKRLSLSLLRKRGGKGLLSQYNNSVQSMVHFIYGKPLEKSTMNFSVQQSKLNSAVFVFQ